MADGRAKTSGYTNQGGKSSELTTSTQQIVKYHPQFQVSDNSHDSSDGYKCLKVSVRDGRTPVRNASENVTMTRSRNVNPSLRPNGDIRANHIKLNNRYDRKKALEKKKSACDRVSSLENKNGNLIISLDTYTFEQLRNIIIETIHIPRNGGSSRHVEYTQVKDDSNLTVQDTIKFKNWSALGRLANGKCGSCNLTMNLYRTTSRILINGPDYQQLTCTMQSLLDKTANNSGVKEANKTIKDLINNCPNPKRHTKAKARVHRSALDSCTSPDEVTRGLDTGDFSSLPSSRSTDLLPISHEAPRGCSTCPICKNEVIDVGVLCETCDYWFHYPCLGIFGINVQYVEDSNSPYMCSSCTVLTRQDHGGQTPDKTWKHSSILPPSPRYDSTTNHTDSPGYSNPTPADTPREIVVATANQTNHQTSGRTPLATKSAGQHPEEVPPNPLGLELFTRGPEVDPVSPTTPPSAQQNAQLAIRGSTMDSVAQHTTTQSIRNEPQQPTGGNPTTDGAAETRTANSSRALSSKWIPSSAELIPGEDPGRPALEADQKKIKAKERQLKQRERNLELKEEEIKTVTQQTALLKATVSRLELRVKDLEQENRELKLKLLASEDLRESHPQTPSESLNSTQHTQQRPGMQDLIMTSLVAILASLIDKKEPQGTQAHHPPQNEYYRNNHRQRQRHHRRPNAGRYNRWEHEEYNQRRPPPLIYEYNHSEVNWDFKETQPSTQAPNYEEPAPPPPIFIDLTLEEEIGEELQDHILTPATGSEETIDLTHEDTGDTEPNKELTAPMEGGPAAEENNINPTPEAVPETPGIPTAPFLEMGLPPQAPDKSPSAQQTLRDSPPMQPMQES